MSATIFLTFKAMSGLVPGVQRAMNSASDIGGNRSSKAFRFLVASAMQRIAATRKTDTKKKSRIIGSPSPIEKDQLPGQQENDTRPSVVNPPEASAASSC